MILCLSDGVMSRLYTALAPWTNSSGLSAGWVSRLSCHSELPDTQEGPLFVYSDLRRGSGHFAGLIVLTLMPGDTVVNTRLLNCCSAIAA